MTVAGLWPGPPTLWMVSSGTQFNMSSNKQFFPSSSTFCVIKKLPLFIYIFFKRFKMFIFIVISVICLGIYFCIWYSDHPISPIWRPKCLIYLRTFSTILGFERKNKSLKARDSSCAWECNLSLRDRGRKITVSPAWATWLKRKKQVVGGGDSQRFRALLHLQLGSLQISTHTCACARAHTCAHTRVREHTHT